MVGAARSGGKLECMVVKGLGPQLHLETSGVRMGMGTGHGGVRMEPGIAEAEKDYPHFQ
jgi:hypothetical protein